MLKKLLLPIKENNYEAFLVRKVAVAMYTLILLSVNYFLPIFLPISDQVLASSITTTNIIEMTNLERQNQGLKPLRNNTALSAAAHEKALDMLSKDYWNHFGPSGETPWQFIKSAGYEPYQYAGENLAKGFRSSEGVHQAWMASPTHRANLMDDNYADIGVAVVNGHLQGEEVTLVVQIFGTLVGDKYALSNSSIDISAVESNIQAPIGDNGDISSIKIQFPLDGSTVTNPQVRVKGIVVGDSANSAVKITDRHVVIGTTDLDRDSWEYLLETDWDQGFHDVSAEVDSQNDTVEFTVDSVGPELSKETVDKLVADNAYLVTVDPAEEEVTGFVSVGGKSYILEAGDNNELIAHISTIDINPGDEIKVVAQDAHGNQSEYYLEGESIPLIMGIVDTFKHPVGLFNNLFVLFVLALLGIQIYGYRKLGILNHRGGHLFTFAMWGILVTVTLLTKSAGIIG